MSMDEDEIKRKLGIASWRELSKDKVKKLVAIMPDMDVELRMKIVEQFPNFKSFATDLLKIIEENAASIIEANSENARELHTLISATRDILAKQLDRDDLDKEDRRYIVDQLMKLVEFSAAADRDNKHFLDGVLNKLVFAGGLLAAFGVLVLGGRFLLEAEDDDE